MKNLLTIISLVVIAIALSLFIDLGQNSELFKKASVANVAETPAPQSEKEKQPDMQIYKKLEAKAGCILDIEKDKIIFKHNSTKLMPLASLTKLMTAIVAIENLPQNTLIEITEDAILQEGDSGFVSGQRWYLEDLLKIMLLSSSNDSAYSIASSLRKDIDPDPGFFINLMNKKTEDINLTNIYFLNPTGLDVSKTQAGAYGSCEDVVRLMAYILKQYPGLLNITTQKSAVFNNLYFENTNKLAQKLPFFLAGKTGFSDLAGGNLVIVVNRGLGRPIAIAVLGSSFEGRFNDIEILYNEFVWF